MLFVMLLGKFISQQSIMEHSMHSDVNGTSYEYEVCIIVSIKKYKNYKESRCA